MHMDLGLLHRDVYMYVILWPTSSNTDNGFLLTLRPDDAMTRLEARSVLGDSFWRP